MAKRDITGVAGFFNDYEEGPGRQKPRPESRIDGQPVKEEKKQPETTPRARVGRPPGVTSGSRSEKAKATMHINRALLDYYRDWSWEARCNLGALIERAMIAFKETRKDTNDGGRERKAATH